MSQPTVPAQSAQASAPAYSIACPLCGKALQPVALDPLTAPWLCPICQRGYWAADLESVAAGEVVAATWAWTHPSKHLAHADAVAQEQAQAHARGTSLRPDQIAIAHAGVLQSLAKRSGVESSFAAQVTTHLTNSGVA